MSHQPESYDERVALDREARQRCLDPAESFIVQAPAGSGKTELLIQRVLSLLATVEVPEEIVAITFTRKAAAEMRVRILRALDAARHDPPEQDHARRSWELARAVLERDAAQGWHLREQPSRLRIMTIDALNGWLTRQMPWISGLGAQPAIADNPEDLYREAVRGVLLGETRDSSDAQELRRLLIHLDNRSAVIEDLFVHMLAIRDQWAGLLEVPSAEAQARGLIEHGLRNVIEEQLTATARSLPEEAAADIVALAHHAATVLEADASLPEPGVLAAFLDKPSLPGTDASGLPGWTAIAHLLLTADGSLRNPRGVNKNLGFTPGDPMKERLKELLERLSDARAFIERLAEVRRLPAAAFSDAQWEILGSMLRALGSCLENLHGIFARRAAVDHVEIARGALRALGSDLEPTDLAMMLEYRIRHLLVDEFQDTSSSQYHLIGLLTAGWSAGDGHTLFLVGDPMQSIYRFREAEVGLFLHVWEQRRIGSVQMQAVRLYRNFRSQASIVSWVNSTFTEVMPIEDSPETGAVSYVPSEPTHPAEDAGVTIETVFGGDRREEAVRLAGLIRQAESGALCGPVETIGVLVRSRGHLRQIVPELRESGISFQAVEIEELGRHPAVLDAMALTRALAHDGDRTAWLAVLRAPWTGVSLTDIHTLCADAPHEPVFSCLGDEDRRARCSAEGRERFVRLHTAMADIRAQRGRKPLRRLVEGCWIALGAPATVDAQGYAAAMSYFDMLESCDEGGTLSDLRTLAESAEKLYAPADPGGEARVQLMTIHKAKGLQFDVVIVPRLDGVPRAEQDRLLLWLERTGGSSVDFLIAPMHERGGEKDPTYFYVRHVLAEKARHEHRRLLYVAATRARKRLILSAPVGLKETDAGVEMKTPHPHSFLAFLWPVLEKEVHARFLHGPAHTPQQEPQTVERPPGIPMRRLRTAWSLPDPPPALHLAGGQGAHVPDHAETEQERWWQSGEEARIAGTVAHLLLARIGREGISWWNGLGDARQEELLRALFARSGMPDVSPERAGQVRTAIAQMADDPRGAWILEDHVEAENEIMLVGRTEEGTERVIIDRTFVDAHGTRWIIDYKTSVHEGGDLTAFLDAQEHLHADTLRRYARIVRALDPRPVRLALYFPLLREFREIRSADQRDNPRTA